MDDKRWVLCPGCSGEIGLPLDWRAATVECPNCGAVANVRVSENGLEWCPRSSTQVTEPVSTQSSAVPSKSPSLPVSGVVGASSGSQSSDAGHQKNVCAMIGLSLGIAAVFLAFIGIIPILAIVFSGIGLTKAQECEGNGSVQAWIGLILGILFTIVYLNIYGHLQ